LCHFSRFRLLFLTFVLFLLSLQLALAERLSDYLSQCSIRYCFQRPFNPLNKDLDLLFAPWIQLPNSPALVAADTAEAAFDVTDMSQFMPLGSVHGARACDKPRAASDGNMGSPTAADGRGCSDGYGSGEEQSYRGGGRSAPTSPSRPPAPGASATATNAWLTGSALVRSAGPLAHMARSKDSFYQEDQQGEEQD
jgi:hypothetical protein